MEITRPNQVWAMDITYIPMARGFVYLAGILERDERASVGHRDRIVERPFPAALSGHAAA
jgi:transposase InsO family protein